ncbi:hypothetical protein NIES4075_60510 [Tolypothrix sp. NIES-4075]|nr:hypothetical protein NIES4075_60510 [Tolypothrix sp. NIES-4075]
MLVTTTSAFIMTAHEVQRTGEPILTTVCCVIAYVNLIETQQALTKLESGYKRSQMYLFHF